MSNTSREELKEETEISTCNTKILEDADLRTEAHRFTQIETQTVMCAVYTARYQEEGKHTE